MAQRSPLIGSIVERTPTTSASKPISTTSAKTGFPAVQHRSKSLFARNRGPSKTFGDVLGESKPIDVPVVIPVPRTGFQTSISAKANENKDDGWRDQISKENEERVADMSEAEREEERRQIVEKFGVNIGDVLKRARMARERQKQAEKASAPVDMLQEEIPITFEERKIAERARSPPPSALVTPSTTRPSSRADRRLRFAELDPDDVHVYESTPSSPKRRVLALPPPDSSSTDTVSLGQWRGKMSSHNPITLEGFSGGSAEPDAQAVGQVEKEEMAIDREPDEGSAEFIRRRYFPEAPKDDPNLAWMHGTPDAIPPDSISSSLRFDLHGNPIPPSMSLSLPTHLGLHHHAEGSHAGYTLDDIFLLSRSTVPAQRATMLGILSRIARRLAGVARGVVDGMNEVVGKEEELRKRILAAGVEAIAEKGSVGARAIEVVLECVVGWSSHLPEVHDVELETPKDLAISGLPLDFLLPQIAALLSQGAIPQESQTQLLYILLRLAQHSNSIASSIVSTENLLAIITKAFLLTSIPPSHDNPSLPNPVALQLLRALSMSSRTNALEVEHIADSLLRFVTFLPTSSPYPGSLAVDLPTETLRVYSTLASYGLYSQIAGTAVTQWAQLEQYITSKACKSSSLRASWASLVEAWTTCAVDPHQTTPAHAITWSQIAGWDWIAGLSELQSHLGLEEEEWPVWSACWHTKAAWLEGSKINGVRGGESERNKIISDSPFEENGQELEVVIAAVDGLEKALFDYSSGSTNITKKLQNLTLYTSVLSSAIRLWLACVPSHFDGPPANPPFPLPFSRLSELSSNLLTHPLWSAFVSDGEAFEYIYRREISQFLSFYLRLSRRLPGVSEGLWIAQAFSILTRLGPGDEDLAEGIMRDAMKLITPQWATVRNIPVSPLVWEKGGLAVLEPFLHHTLRPLPDAYIGPTIITPMSIKHATTQRLPPPTRLKDLGLPLSRDWMMTPMDHLLRSADSPVFKALPISWDASEVEVTRAALFLTKIVQEALLNRSLSILVLTREEAVFRCMQVFMLEHGQSQSDSTEEVFRDSVVGRFMEDLLQVYASGTDPQFPSTGEQGNLEVVSTRFLGPSVPFFQFYTDFVALYDAISFSHPLFASLLLTPSSMHYPEDFRKHLWNDFGHVLKGVRTPPEKIFSADLHEFLYPIESNSQILGAYLSSLLRDDLHEFPRLVALHHVASTIWPDLHGLNFREESASVMFKAITQKGGDDVVREIARYHQAKLDQQVLLPPLCFQGLDGETGRSRIERVRRWVGLGASSRIENLF